MKVLKGKPSKPRFRRRLGSAAKTSFQGKQPEFHVSPIKSATGSIAFPTNSSSEAFPKNTMADDNDAGF